ncbi:AfsR/SARP family transcriptional regulator [Nonomuraea sp. NPDC050643]|uniref:AfsR/SARP family transcriptional regulator n=1 Tax=Nonomuraea sp. NPDC050643 TaxID=3155660 RepID=UPI0033DD2FE7
MRFRMLGPLRVRGGAGWTRVAAGQQRVALAVLLVHAGRIVSRDQLADAIWGDRPPRTTANTVAAYVMRLRRLLGGHVLVTRERGYELTAGEGDVDADVFERSLATARRESQAGRLEVAALRLSRALNLWQGQGAALADVPETPALAARVTYLEQLRLGAEEEHARALLDLGRHGEVVEALRRLAEEGPLRERRWALLMTALARCGRRAEALETYQRARRVLCAELGVEPGPELRRLQGDVLTQTLAPPSPRGPATLSVPTLRPEPGRSFAPVPAQLPAAVGHFTGRAGQLARLDALLRPGDGRAAGVCVVTGPPGVGKTALATHWAHRVRDRFPDGQLYVSLRGYGTPVRPGDALAGFLRALGVPAGRVPSDVHEAGGLYRSLLTGRRLLVLLDDARDPDQVRPLLPGGPGCLALVTSRDRLTGLIARDGARPLTLDVLSDPEAHALLTALIGDHLPTAPQTDPAHPCGDGIAAAPGAELARLCGNLPLALRIAAANLAARPHTTPTEYAATLATDPLGGLDVDGDPRTGVRAAFDASYAALEEDARNLFRRLGPLPAAHVTAQEAATLIAAAPATAARLLRRLATAHVVEEHAAGRYGLHPLLRAYAAEKAAAENPAADAAARAAPGTAVEP